MYGHPSRFLKLKEIKIQPRVKLNKQHIHVWANPSLLVTAVHARQIYKPRGSCFLPTFVYSFDDVLNQNKAIKTAPLE